MEDKDEKRNKFYRNDKEDYKITIQQLLNEYTPIGGQIIGHRPLCYRFPVTDEYETIYGKGDM